jgi:hypothetical protein
MACQTAIPTPCLAVFISRECDPKEFRNALVRLSPPARPPAVIPDPSSPKHSSGAAWGRAANHCRPSAMTVSELVMPFLAGLVLPLVAMAVAHWLWPTF